MKKIVALKGIKTVSYVIGDKVKLLFAFTENMRSKLVFIEIYEAENIDDPESDEGRRF
jgi:hypothetical protein